jgi:23S rRNA pseudouridine2605 synthase
VVLEEGRNRQIRRMLAAVGLDVVRLVRVRMGILRLGGLTPGQGRWLTQHEVSALQRSAGLREPRTRRRSTQRKGKSHDG